MQGFHQSGSSLKVGAVSFFISMGHPRTKIARRRLYKLCIYLINRCHQWCARKCFTTSSWDGKVGGEQGGWRLQKAMSSHTCRFLWQTHSTKTNFYQSEDIEQRFSRDANNQFLQFSSSTSPAALPAHMLNWQTDHILLEKKFSPLGYIEYKPLAQ